MDEKFGQVASSLEDLSEIDENLKTALRRLDELTIPPIIKEEQEITDL